MEATKAHTSSSYRDSHETFRPFSPLAHTEKAKIK